MKVVTAFVLVVLISVLIGVAVVRARSQPTIFVASPHKVAAYPVAGRGDVAPIALTTDMALPSGIARDVGGRIYVTNSATHTVTVYAAGSNGNVPPIAVVGGSRTGIANPKGLALDSDGKIYVLNSFGNRAGSITVYPPLGNNVGVLNEVPVATIAGAKTLLDDATGIAIDAQNKIYVANEMGGPLVRGESFDKGRLTVYASGRDGNVSPAATISGAATGLSLPIGIALDSSGNIYVVNSHTANIKTADKLGPSITVYPAGTKGNASPSAIIAGANTGLQNLGAIGLDSIGNLYVTGLVCPGLCGGNSFFVNVYASSSNGNTAPSAQIIGADTGLGEPTGIVLDSVDRLYVLNSVVGASQGSSVTVYGAGSSGDESPTITITSNFSGLPYANSVAVDSIGNLYVSNPLGVAGERGAVDVYPAGSYATGSPSATITGADTGLDVPTKVATDSNGDIFVLNFGSVVTSYAAGSVGDATPMSMLNVGIGESTFATGIAVGPGGKLYVAGQCTHRHCAHGFSDVAVYPSGSAGSAAPSAIIGGPRTALANSSAVTVDHSGNIYVTNEGPSKCMRGCCFPNGAGSVTIFAPGSNGDAAPTSTIAGANTGLRFPYGVALDPSGNIYVLNATGVSGVCIGQTGGVANRAGSGGFTDTTVRATIGPILIFAAGSNGDAVPIGTIGGRFTGLDSAAGIAIGPGAP